MIGNGFTFGHVIEVIENSGEKEIGPGQLEWNEKENEKPELVFK